MPPFTPKNREQKDREKARTRRGIFFARERREKSLNFFFRTEQTAKEGDSSGVFFVEETKKDEFYRFLERDIISRGTSSSSSNVTSPARALRITTHE